MLLLASALLSTAVVAPVEGGDDARVRHELTVTLDASARRLAVVDTLRLPPGKPAEFLLNAVLQLTRAEPAVDEVPLGDVAFFSINSGADVPRQVTLKRYRAKAAPADGVLHLEYSGPFDFGLSDQKEEYTRGFRETAGIVSPEGVYLAGSGFWYPYLGKELVEFALEVTQPEGWHVISEGNGTSRDEAGRAHWQSAGPSDEIHLVGGPLLRYRDSAGSVEALAYLRQKDDALAARYLTATAQYVEMYRWLIGPYPYGKFALVENFWETGYGMPSFTLLGPQIIRFPFILVSSYPHEILHNWWGNSVFVDDRGGNWCEGLTAYLADHLIEEQRGKGAEHRQSTLRKFRDYVKAGRDFPLAEFRGRHSAATEAVGYGKTMLGFHMLRRQLGDEGFRKALARFYREQRGKRASFADLRQVMEAVSGRDLARFFADWVTRPGAATLELGVVAVQAQPQGGFLVSGTLKQTQAGIPFALDVPVVVQTAGKAVSQVVRLDAAGAAFAIASPEKPLAVHVDPEFDVFRRLDPRETSPSLGQIFGEPKILALLPSRASAEEQAAYRKLAEGWQSDSHAIEVRLDSEVAELPKDRAAWLFGRSNRLAASLFPASAASRVEGDTLHVDGETMPLANHSFVLTARHPANLEKAVGWIVVEPAAAFPGTGRKLPHYGKYSYLGFEGAEPANVLKGQWAASDSPLRRDLRPQAERATPLGALALPARKALAELPPVFSQKALLEHVQFLASPDLEGRGLGSPGLQKAGDYLVARFREMGLAPCGDAGGFTQAFSVPKGPTGTPVAASNVIGCLPGTRPEWKDQSAIVSAHFDHLGRGWPDVHKGDEDKVHPGADDNASGVAVLLELAKVLASGEKPARTIVFIAFSAEESGLSGSKHYAEHPRFPLDQVMGVINLDTVGRLRDQKLSVLGTGTASEWQHIFRGAGFVTGVESRNLPESLQASDQASFVAKGVPAVQIFTGAHADYHRPGDTADAVDGAGLVKVATFVKEGVQYLAEREQPLTNTIPKGGTPPPAAPGGQGQGRRVSFGTVPDFGFAGPGVRVSGVVASSPAEKAGLREGDIILKLDGKDVANLAGFSDVLKTLQPGQTVAVALKRDGQEQTVQVTVVER
jgi:hypothetical protein